MSLSDMTSRVKALGFLAFFFGTPVLKKKMIFRFKIIRVRIQYAEYSSFAAHIYK